MADHLHVVEQAATTSPPQPENDFNFKVFFPLVDYVQSMYGEAEAQRLVREIDLELTDLKNSHLWIPLDSVRKFLSAVWGMVKDEDEFRRACTYRLRESYGPLRFLLRAASSQMIYDMAIEHFPAISKISSSRLERISRSQIRITYWSSKEESRLMCISRQAQSAALPTLWGLPQAHMNETKCMSFGDDCCEYELRLYHTKSWLPIFLGAFGGVAMAVLLFLADLFVISGGALWALLPTVGALLGYAMSLKRMNDRNFEVSEEINEELRKHVRENVEVRSEIEAANRRQREWSRLMEEQVSERTEALENVVRDINRMQAERNDAIRGYSHDLKNPFFILSMITESLTGMRDKMEDDVWMLVEEQIEAVTRMQHMLDNLVTAATKTTRAIWLTAEHLMVAPLVDILRRRLKAFVHGRDIRVSVFSNREAPEEIETDRLLFDRVVDNLLTNAAKYTSQGSIVVEIDGKPGFLTLKVSDTGRGIDEANLIRIFMPEGSIPDRREKWSHGVGLSVVVRLMAQIGGKVDVMSLPGKGTTFWAHFPVSLKMEDESQMKNPRISKLTPEDLFLRVVKVRRPEQP